MEYKDMNDKELIEEYAGFHQMIEGIGCSSVKDIMNRDAIAYHLEQRGYELSHTPRWWKEGMPPAVDYEKAYYILMEYWDSLPDEEKPNIDKKLKELGL